MLFHSHDVMREALPLDGAIKALDLLETITRNTAQNPQEEKFRRVRTTNVPGTFIPPYP